MSVHFKAWLSEAVENQIKKGDRVYKRKTKPDRHMATQRHSQKSIAAKFIVVLNWNQHKCPSRWDEQTATQQRKGMIY